MPNHGPPGAGAKGDATLKTIMDQAIGDDMFKNTSQRVVNWVDERPTSEEAKDFGDKGRLAPVDATKTSESGDAVPQFQEVAVSLATADTAGRAVFDAAADTASTSHADAAVQIAQADGDHTVMHEAVIDAHSADTPSGSDASAVHHVDAAPSVGEEATA